MTEQTGAFRIGEREVGSGAPALLIAEVAQAHDGSLGLAHAHIDAAADADADAVKFQTHIAAAESTPAEPWRVKFSAQDATRYDYWRRMEFTEEQWAGLKAHAEERGLTFLSSAFSVEAVDLLERIGVRAHKLASGEVGDTPVIDRVLAAGRPVLISTGMSALAETDGLVEKVRAAGVPFAVLQCTSAYPTPPEQVGVDMVARMRERYAVPTGLSDHSGTIFPALAAATLGADIIEVHLTLSRRMFGPDVASSVTVEEFGTLARGVRYIEAMTAAPTDKDAVAASLGDVRRIFAPSLVAARDLVEGTVLGPGDLVAKKSGGGMPADREPDLLGRRLVRALSADEPIRPEDTE